MSSRVQMSLVHRLAFCLFTELNPWSFCLSPVSSCITHETKITFFLVWNIQTESISQISVSVYTGHSWAGPHGKSCTVSEGQIGFHISIANNELNTHTATDSTSRCLRRSLMSLALYLFPSRPLSAPPSLSPSLSLLWLSRYRVSFSFSLLLPPPLSAFSRFLALGLSGFLDLLWFYLLTGISCPQEAISLRKLHFWLLALIQVRKKQKKKPHTHTQGACPEYALWKSSGFQFDLPVMNLIRWHHHFLSPNINP